MTQNEEILWIACSNCKYETSIQNLIFAPPFACDQKQKYVSITIAAFGRGVGSLCPAISQLHYSQSFKGQPLILWAYISSQMSMFILVPFQGRETLQLLASNPFGQKIKVAHFCESLENVETQTCTAKNE